MWGLESPFDATVISSLSFDCLHRCQILINSCYWLMTVAIPNVYGVLLQLAKCSLDMTGPCSRLEGFSVIQALVTSKPSMEHGSTVSSPFSAKPEVGNGFTQFISPWCNLPMRGYDGEASENRGEWSWRVGGCHIAPCFVLL